MAARRHHVPERSGRGDAVERGDQFFHDIESESAEQKRTRGQGFARSRGRHDRVVEEGAGRASGFHAASWKITPRV